jgi:molecular chaperone GrpE
VTGVEKEAGKTMSNNPDQNGQFSPEAEARGTASGSSDPASGAPDASSPSDLSSLLAKAESNAADFKDAWLRAKAETDNVRKQGQNDVAKAHKYAVERFAQELLTVKDSLELALAAPNVTIESLKDGVELTLKNLNAAFAKTQISEINPAGEKYDPHRHQAMTAIESEQAPNTVLQVFQKGYALNDRVLRPALVAVAKAKG